MRLLSYLLTLLVIMLLLNAGYAQTCNGSLGAPVVNETFGSGSSIVGPPLPAGVTNLRYNSDPCGGNDGEYSILSSLQSSCKGGTWQADADHDGNGYMMVVNADYSASVFYTQRVAGSTLCPNTTYYFGAYVMNILRKLPQTTGYANPNITFSIETVNGTVLKRFTTGEIPAEVTPEWHPYGALFTSPANGEDVIIKMTNNTTTSNGAGNDLALDDITFSPCGPLIQTGFTTIGSTAVQPECEHTPFNFTLVSQQTGYPNPSYQWQYKTPADAGWHDVVSGGTQPSLSINVNDPTAGTYQYRVAVLSGNNTLVSCRIYSDPLIISVTAQLNNVIPTVTNVCAGQPLQLVAAGGDSYQWSGPGGFTSTDSQPIVTSNATAADDGGIYNLTVIKNGCPQFFTTRIKLFNAPAFGPSLPITVPVCAGSSVPLTVTTINATHYKWTPATGLDHDDVEQPLASPAETTNYQLKIWNDGCADAVTTNLTVNVLKLPKANAGPDLRLFAGQTARLNGQKQGDMVSFYWTPTDYLDDPTSLTPITSAPQDITYTLHVYSNNTCGENDDQVFVRVYQPLKIANSFTPNGDNTNDLWKIDNLATYPHALISVYDRDGQQVFQSRGYPRPWDGTYHGAPLPAGTYYYVIDLQETDLPVLKGWIFIAR